MTPSPSSYPIPEIAAALAAAEPAAAAQARDDLCAAFAARERPDGVWLAAAAWLVRATAPDRSGAEKLRAGLGPAPPEIYSHSMVPGGLLVMSSVTRLTSGTSLVMRVEIAASTS